MRASKGSAFEREICKLLSKWWTGGKRDDIFWRTSQSGGRATTRAQKGQTTYGSHGDIAAVDPIGLPFLKRFTVELKRGNSHGTIADLLDNDGAVQLPIQQTIRQAIQSAIAAHSDGWLIIHKRDRKKTMVYVESNAYFGFGKAAPRASVTFLLPPNFNRVRFIAMPLDDFLNGADPFDESWSRANP